MFAGVDERAREAGAKVDVVRAAGPLESLRRRSAYRPIASAVIQFSGRAGPGEGVRHAGRRYGVHESRLSRTCNMKRCAYNNQSRGKKTIDTSTHHHDCLLLLLLRVKTSLA